MTDRLRQIPDIVTLAQGHLFAALCQVVLERLPQENKAAATRISHGLNRGRLTWTTFALMSNDQIEALDTGIGRKSIVVFESALLNFLNQPITASNRSPPVNPQKSL